MKQVCVIGHFAWKTNDMIGAVVKARSICEELQHQLGIKQVGQVDIYHWRKHAVPTLARIVRACARYQHIVLVCSDTSTLMMQLFKILKKLFHNTIHYAVVGGDMAEIFEQHPERIVAASIIDHIYVETQDCLQDLQKIGFTNAELMRNFKCITALEEHELATWPDGGEFRFCTFSRIIEQKGILDAMVAVDQINQMGKQHCSLDVYGTVDPSFKEIFEHALLQYSDTKYQGCVDSSKSVEILQDYYCLLFPTRYQTEGIPGTIVDGFAAGVPVICSMWSRYSQVVHPYFDGIVYAFGDVEALREAICWVIENPDAIRGMKTNCLKTYQTYYAPEKAIQPLLQNMQVKITVSK